MPPAEYSRRLGPISAAQFQAALDRFDLGRFVGATAVPFGLFGQNVFVTSTAGEFVLRGAAHYDWQLPQERFVAGLLHERTAVPAPWPYLVDTDESVFGWRYGFAILPRLPGLQLADRAVLAALSGADRREIAGALGANLREVQRVQWRHAGRFDVATGEPRAFDGGFAGWIVGELRRWLRKSIASGTGAGEADADWAEGVIAAAADALRAPCTPVLVLHDYKEGNVTVERRGGAWAVSGVFDLMEAVFGDGELDLARQLAGYLEADDPTLAPAFLAGYVRDRPLRPGARERLALFLVYDRMIVWEYFHRPQHRPQWWYDAATPREWIAPYLAKLDGLLLAAARE
ncbi:MAG TPA: aminoglycoside phosphotransferase family protein [Pilimelia sp.]|nr:aminoglycoside phosphotransferase family protein [Pilimelia sp.]